MTSPLLWTLIVAQLAMGLFDILYHHEMTERLAWWKQRIDEKAAGIRRVFGFFNNDYSGYSIATCNRFKRILGIEVKKDGADGIQGNLF